MNTLAENKDKGTNTLETTHDKEYKLKKTSLK
jgi:hypothetical protein